MVSVMIYKLSRSRGLWPCDFYMGLSLVYITRKWRLPNDHHLYLGEVDVRWKPYNQLASWGLINWVNGECLVSQHSGRPLLLEYLVNIIDILGHQYSWYQMWYRKRFWVSGEYRWYPGGQYSWYQMWYLNVLSKWWISFIFWEANTLISNVICKPCFEYLMNIGCQYSGRSRLLISNVISYHKFE